MGQGGLAVVVSNDIASQHAKAVRLVFGGNEPAFGLGIAYAETAERLPGITRLPATSMGVEILLDKFVAARDEAPIIEFAPFIPSERDERAA